MNELQDLAEQARELVAQGEQADPAKVQETLRGLIKADPEGFEAAMRSR